MAQLTSDLSITRSVKWPDGKKFAFTIFDDTDDTTLPVVSAVYDLLRECGIRTTKSVWPLSHPGAPAWTGLTCEDPEYLRWLKGLQADGFEIGYHGASCGDDRRQEIARGLGEFSGHFGHFPVVSSNHSASVDAIYWGDARTTGLRRWLYLLMTGFKTWRHSKGHVPESPHFWGDICMDKTEFMRNFVFADINTLNMCPYMPYRDPTKPYVNAWYASSDGRLGDEFCRLLSVENQEKLEREGGACIVYTHFACGFVRDGTLREDFKHLVRGLSKRDGWFVPTGQLLRYLRDQHGGIWTLTPSERRQLEWKWLRDKVFLGST